MTVGFYSPLPPAPTGVADYSSTLLPLLRSCGTVEIAPENCDVALYHVGNNALHRDIYLRALAHPGVVVLHDAVLQHLLLGMLDRNQYVEEFVYNYGENDGDRARELGRQLWEQRARSGADFRYFAHPMLKRLAAASRAIIVHNPAAARLVREHVREPAAQTPVVEIPHLFERPALPSPEETRRFRESLGITPETLLIGTFGHQRETKRLSVLLRAFQSALRAHADVRLLVSGEFVSGTFENAITPLFEHPGVIRTRYLPEPELWRYAAATDLCINLRYPSAAETSGIAVRMMGIGKPVVFTASEALDRIPANACLRLDVGPDEEQMLAGYITWLAANRQAALEIGRRAAAHIAQCHAPEKVAREFWNVLGTYRGANKY
jgi:glycosyltransferase involved in cell wall biosynthesis